MTIRIDTVSDYLLLGFLPFLLFLMFFMFAGLLRGPERGGFRLVLTWPWLFLAIPVSGGGVAGIVGALGA